MHNRVLRLLRPCVSPPSSSLSTGNTVIPHASKPRTAIHLCPLLPLCHGAGLRSGIIIELYQEPQHCRIRHDEARLPTHHPKQQYSKGMAFCVADSELDSCSQAPISVAGAFLLGQTCKSWYGCSCPVTGSHCESVFNAQGQVCRCAIHFGVSLSPSGRITLSLPQRP